MLLDIRAPENVILQPIITVFGVGGAGGNAVNNMIKCKLKGANFVVTNTDAQALMHSESTNKIQLGAALTKGLGAGASPEVGMSSAIESETEIKSYLEGSNMVFITAGMGGGTGTGASPVIARLAKELGILTVGVVTKPFLFEGAKRMKVADQGIAELQKYVDTLIVIPNQNLFRIANENTTFQEAFELADEVLHAGVRGVTDLITSPGLVNLDFADIVTIMSEKGKAMMGTGEASGEDRAIRAAEAAIANPLLDQTSMQGASGVLINITGGKDMTLYEVDSAANRIREEVGSSDANIIFGSTFNPELEGTIRVSVVSTGIKQGEDNYHIKPQQENYNVEVGANGPLSYDEYDNKFTSSEDSIENAVENDSRANFENFEIQMDWSRPEQIDEIDVPVAVPVSEAIIISQKPKPSLLRRMWNSLKTNEPENIPPRHEIRHEKDPIISPIAADRASDIQDVPVFFKKD